MDYYCKEEKTWRAEANMRAMRRRSRKCGGERTRRNCENKEKMEVSDYEEKEGEEKDNEERRGRRDKVKGFPLSSSA